jgi:hypothetical protein
MQLSNKRRSQHASFLTRMQFTIHVSPTALDTRFVVCIHLERTLVVLLPAGSLTVAWPTMIPPGWG